MCIKRHNEGYAIIWMLLLVAVFGLSLSAVGEATAHASARRREAELLHAGEVIVNAIHSYYSSHGRYPLSMDSLLEDRANGLLRRHLRQIPRDPMSSKKDWIELRNSAGELTGVRSRSSARPIKSKPTTLGLLSLPPVESYDQWHFEYIPVGLRL